MQNTRGQLIEEVPFLKNVWLYEYVGPHLFCLPQTCENLYGRQT